MDCSSHWKQKMVPVSFLWTCAKWTSLRNRQTSQGRAVRTDLLAMHQGNKNVFLSKYFFPSKCPYSLTRQNLWSYVQDICYMFGMLSELTTMLSHYLCVIRASLPRELWLCFGGYCLAPGDELPRNHRSDPEGSGSFPYCWSRKDCSRNPKKIWTKTELVSLYLEG